jgi:FKBP-type peptidyl-prolyl cis-trans isomerase 2
MKFFIRQFNGRQQFMKKKFTWQIARQSLALCLAILGVLPPAGADSIAALSSVPVKYTCTLPDGRLADTTSRLAAENKGLAKSPLFSNREVYEPATVRVKADGGGHADWREVSFRGEIIRLLGYHAADMRPGVTKRISLASKVIEDMPEAERFIKIRRVQKRLKINRMQIEAFRRGLNQEPVEGARHTLGDGISAEVVSVGEREVELRFLAAPGQTIKTPYGEAAVTETGEFFELDIDARTGTLLRAGPLVGRITHVDKEWITIDFGHPFGGETLICDVTLESIQQGAEHPVIAAEAATPQIVRAGDAVRVNFTARTSAGEPIAASRREAAENPKLNGHRSFAGEAVDGPVSLIAGEASEIPGLATEIIGMKPGENKRVQVPAERAYGPLRSSDVTVFPAVRRLPRVMAMGPAEYKKNFQSEPRLEAEVALTPYFNGRVVAFENENPVIAALPAEGRISEKFGTVDIRLAGDEVVMRMAAKVGAEFELNGRTGRITQADSEQFTVDFNHPLAGREIVLEIEVVSLIKAERLREEPLPWIEDHEAGLAEGARRKKPVVLVLHAEWCDGCKKLSAESLQDGRIKILKDDFVWVKVDSDKQPLMAELYEQKSFPTIVILGTQGKVVKKIEGYRDAAALRRELESVR